jgi:hypothetical protein
MGYPLPPPFSTLNNVVFCAITSLSFHTELPIGMCLLEVTHYWLEGGIPGSHQYGGVLTPTPPCATLTTPSGKIMGGG